MRAKRIQGADPTPIGAPPDWKEEENGHCTALFVREDVIDGVAFKHSAWEGEDGEALRMLAGASLVLGVNAKRHPVVRIGFAELPEIFEPVMQARTFTAPDGTRVCRVEMLFSHDGGKRAYANVIIDGTLADAISTGVTRIETFARKEGWSQ